jgi:quinol monooxygenase YgiN
MARFVIAAFKPKPGMELRLRMLVDKHWQVLRAESLVTSRPSYLMQAADGTILEVFEWASSDAIDRAHSSPVVQALWAEFEGACEYVPLSSLKEAAKPFSEFRPLDE